MKYLTTSLNTSLNNDRRGNVIIRSFKKINLILLLLRKKKILKTKNPIQLVRTNYIGYNHNNFISNYSGFVVSNDFIYYQYEISTERPFHWSKITKQEKCVNIGTKLIIRNSFKIRIRKPFRTNLLKKPENIRFSFSFNTILCIRIRNTHKKPLITKHGITNSFRRTKALFYIKNYAI